MPTSPGPWRAEASGADRWVVDATGNPIITVCVYETQRFDEGNTRLIAAAPALRDALTQLVRLGINPLREDSPTGGMLQALEDARALLRNQLGIVLDGAIVDGNGLSVRDHDEASGQQ